MKKTGSSRRSTAGNYTHYDEKGHKIGKSTRGFMGSYNNYDEKGHKVGQSRPSIMGGYNHYDKDGHKIGHSDQGFMGTYKHYDAKGDRAGSSGRGAGGFSHYDSSGGCYIATCVYGSYDCPHVWTLRRYRDRVLAQRIGGRLFIRIYYKVSPVLVRYFGNFRYVRGLWKRLLDPAVSVLRRKGY